MQRRMTGQIRAVRAIDWETIPEVDHTLALKTTDTATPQFAAGWNGALAQSIESGEPAALPSAMRRAMSVDYVDGWDSLIATLVALRAVKVAPKAPVSEVKVTRSFTAPEPESARGTLESVEFELVAPVAKPVKRGFWARLGALL